MKLTTGILAIAVTITAGGAWAQNPDAIDNARNAAKALQQAGTPQDSHGKPAPGAPAPAVKPAVIPVSKPAPAAPSKSRAGDEHNQLKRVTVVPNGETIEVEISSSREVTPRVTKMSGPARVVVELPETVVASAQNKIPVGTGGVKGIRIGMDGKTPPTTSVVVDLEKALSYELTPGAAGKLVLTLHTQGGAPAVAKANPAPVPAKTSGVLAAKAPKPAVPAPAAAAVKTAPVPKPAVAKAETPKPAAAASKAAPNPQARTVVAAKPAPAPAVKAAAAPAAAKPAPKPEDKKWAMSGKRDPFFSPVVQQSGSGCSTGKKCLEIGAINLRGVVKSDTGFIAVVTNNLNKAYFLRENDPVFNGYVLKITGDSVTFQETVQDKLGKPFTREVVKRILTPAV
jgi:AMIN domain-containing protein